MVFYSNYNHFNVLSNLKTLFQDRSQWPAMHGCQMAIGQIFLLFYVFCPSCFLIMALLRPHALQPGTIQENEGIKFCRLVTLLQWASGQMSETEIPAAIEILFSPPHFPIARMPCGTHRVFNMKEEDMWGLLVFVRHLSDTDMIPLNLYNLST